MLAVLTFAVLFVLDPKTAEDMEKSYQSLKEAQAQKDADQVKRLAAETCALARQVATVPAPDNDEEKAAWKDRVNYAREVELETEYALAVTAAVATKPEVTIDLLAALEKQNPKSKYLEDSYSRYMLALNQTGAAAKIPAIAEKGLANFPDQEDLLLFMSDYAMTRKQSDRALNYSRRLVTVLNKHPKPANMSEADWERKKSASLARGYWIAGVLCGEKSLFAESDRHLRAALPLIKGNDAMMAVALFYLGVSDYQLGQATLNKGLVLEAQKFSDQAAQIPGPYQQQAWKNAAIMKQTADRMR